MLTLKRLLLGLVIPTLVVSSFLAGRAVSQAPLPTEQPANYSFPRAWGELHDVTQSQIGLAFVFVATDGTIRVVQDAGPGIAGIKVISRR